MIEESSLMAFWHRVKVMLGLADDYDEYDDEYYEEDESTEEYPSRASAAPASPYAAESASVRRVNREPDVVRAREATPVLRSVGAPAPAMAPAAGAAPAPQVRIHTVEPRSFSEVQSIADKFRAGQPVILNLVATDQDLARRLLDFASGLTYGLGGGLQKVSDKVFMLTPANVDVSATDKARLRDSGLFSME
jgi:cell division inhibitor SepF